jgi:hypothetical protein
MYLEAEFIEKDTLRQGDVISSIHILGTINITGILYMSTTENPKDRTGWAIPAAPRVSDAMVISHSCEIALENKIKVTSIILAPLREIHTATPQEKVKELIDSNLIDKDNPEASYIKYFYLKGNSKFEYSSGAVVDFSKCFSVRKNSYEYLLSKKIAQLNPPTVNSMALKLSLYFYRNNISAVA